MDNIRTKLKKTYLKLLKAHAKRKVDKANRLYEKVLLMQAQEGYERRNKESD